MPDREAAADFVIAAYREDGEWQVAAMPPHVADSLDALAFALRQQPGEGGAIGLVSVDEDFFLAVRVRGDETRVLVSDAGAAAVVPLGRSALDHLAAEKADEPFYQAELGPGTDVTVQPAGELGIFSDLGMDAMELGALCDDLELYPDEMLSSVAARLGFAESFERAVDAALD